MHKKALVFACLLASSCASAPAAPACPSTQDEPVSRCRAEVACGRGTPNLNTGLFLGGVGGGENNTALAQYNRCIDRDMDAQKRNSAKH